MYYKFYLKQGKLINLKFNIFFIAPPLKIRFLVPVERVETTIFSSKLHTHAIALFRPL